MSLENKKKILEDLNKRIIQKNEYHYQLKGRIYTINFYPTKKTYYINGALKGNKYDKLEDLLVIADGEVEFDKSVSKVENVDRTPLKGTRRKLKKIVKNCWICNKEFAKHPNIEITLEHKIPLSKGGSNREDNLTLSCKKCNQDRANSLIVKRPQEISFSEKIINYVKKICR